MRQKILLTLLALIIIAIAGGAGAYSIFTNLETDINTKEEALKKAQETIDQLQQENSDLLTNIEETESELDELEDEVRKLQGGLDILSRLTTIDPEILKKYSRVYFLNEHYRPDKLVLIDKKYWVPANDDEFIHKDVWPHLEELLEEAEDDNINLRIISAFRTFDEQKNLNASYNITYGQGANQFSAYQGYSEHQLGTTLDFTTEELGTNYTSLDSTEAYQWLLDNAYKYGFVLSYPEDNEYYQFEPWHWRFVGRELARDLHKRNMNFYDMDQQEIDTYRLDIFQD